MSRIPLFYRIFFLYIDPLICLSGIYLFFFDHPTYIENGVPSIMSLQLITPTADAANPISLPPIVKHLITALGSYSLCVFAMQILLLHQFQSAPNGLNLMIWRRVQFSILLVDLGLLYGAYVADGLDIRSWGSGDWGNNGILGFLVLIRVAFLVGVGDINSGH